jgi:hypothetical protein
MEFIYQQLEEYINNDNFVYKSCGDYIVVLEKLENTQTNELSKHHFRKYCQR